MDDGEDALNSGLAPNQERAIIALLNEPTIKQAAEATGVGERTLYRWMDEPKFSKAYHKARREAFSHAIALTNRYAPHAVNTLVKVMSDAGAGHAAKVSAAVALLRFGREGIELDDLASRVEALEAASAKSEQNAARWTR
jgi:hypothetical protein